MTFKEDLSLAFNPKKISAIEDASFSKSIKPIAIFFLFWLVIHIAVTLINASIDEQALGGVFLFALLTGLSIAIMGLVGLIVLGFVAAYSSKLFGGKGDLQQTLVLVSVGVLPIVLVGVVRDLISLVSTIGNHFLVGYFIHISIALFVITFVWLACLLSQSIAVANGIGRLSALACFILGFVAASIVNWPINWVLVKVVTNLLMGVL